jgi:hypothetical protein
MATNARLTIHLARPQEVSSAAVNLMDSLRVGKEDVDVARGDESPYWPVFKVHISLVAEVPPSTQTVQKFRKPNGKRVEQSEYVRLEDLEGDVERINGQPDERDAHGRGTTVIDL